MQRCSLTVTESRLKTKVHKWKRELHALGRALRKLLSLFYSLILTHVRLTPPILSQLTRVSAQMHNTKECQKSLSLYYKIISLQDRKHFQQANYINMCRLINNRNVFSVKAIRMILDWAEWYCQSQRGVNTASHDNELEPTTSEAYDAALPTIRLSWFNSLVSNFFFLFWLCFYLFC